MFRLNQRYRRNAGRACLVLLTVIAGFRLQANDGNLSTIRIAGSDFLAGAFTSRFDAYTSAAVAAVEVDMKGSLPGMAALTDGSADIAVLALKPDEASPGEPWVSRPLAYNAVCVVVHPRNPLTQIRLERLAGIFGQGEEFDFSQWGDLGITDWGKRGIKPLLMDRRHDLSQEMFRNVVLSHREFKPTVSTMADPRQMIDAIRTDEAAIGVLGRVPGSTAIKLLPLAIGSGETPLVPSPENIHSGRYPLRMPFVVVYAGNPPDAVREVLTDVFSADLAKAIRDSGFYPIPEQARKQAGLEIGSGR